MKSSFYNIYLNDPKSGISLIYNSLRNSLLHDEKRTVSKILNSGKFDAGLLSPEEFDLLKRNGMIVENNTDEVNIAKSQQKTFNDKRLEKSTSALDLTITPTLDCNFKCYYCYEANHVKKHQSSMPMEIQEDIFKYIRKSIDNGVNKVGVTWYGGEPLVRKDIVIDMQKQINAICKERNIECNASIVTNGLLLTKDVCKELQETSVSFAQISIDGPEELHNKRRYYPIAPKTNFSTLIKNILDSPDDFRITIRINVDNLNKDHIKALIDQLVENKVWPYKKNVSVYPAFIITGIDCADNNNGLSKEDADILNDSVRLYLVNKYNEVCNSDKAKLRFKYPKLNGSDASCGYGAHPNSWVVDYEGKLYRCWEAVGVDDLVLGTTKDLINDLGNEISKKAIDRESRREKWGCHSCKYFPICGFGCPWDYLNNSDVRKCTEWKFTLGNRLISQYKQYLENPSIFASTPFMNE